MNLGALYIASAIREAGNEVVFIDLVRYLYSDIEIQDIIEAAKPALIAFTGIITTYYHLELLSNMLRKTFGDVLQIVGGSLGPSAINLIEANTSVDFICAGEGEEIIVDFINEVKAEKRWSIVPNIYYREKGDFKASEVQNQYVRDLDSLALPAYDLVDMEFYISYTSSVFKEIFDPSHKPHRIMTIVCSRGCPYSCSFCYRLIKKWRHHSTENLINHLKVLKHDYGITSVVFNDELIFVDSEWFIEFCESLSKSNLDFSFSCGGGKSSLITNEMLVAMKKSSFKRIGYGIESGSPKILKAMNKGVSKEQNFHAIRLTLEHKMLSFSNIVFGHPGENKQTIKETFEFMDDVYKLQERYNVVDDNLQIWFATAYPGTQIYEYALSNGLIGDEREYLLSVTSQNCYLLNLSEFSSISKLRNQVFRGIGWLNIKKYFRRKKIRLALKEILRYFYNCCVYFGTFGKYASLSDLRLKNAKPINESLTFRGKLRKSFDKSKIVVS